MGEEDRKIEEEKQLELDIADCTAALEELEAAKAKLETKKGEMEQEQREERHRLGVS